MATKWSWEEGLHRGRRNIRISTNGKFTSVHMCRALLALGGMVEWTLSGPAISTLSFLQPRETATSPGPQALPSYTLPGEAPS